MENELVSVITDLASTVGMWAVFAWLYISERKAHDKTRRLWNEDLRDIAGLKTTLGNVPPPLPDNPSIPDG